MGASSITVKGIRGEFFAQLERSLAGHWVSYLSFPVESNQGSQDHVWIQAATAMMREWLGGRQAAGFWEDGTTIVNRKFEGTLEVLVDELRRDKTGQILLRTRGLAASSTTLWAQLITALVDQGETGIGYAGEVFFSSAHARNVSDATAQSNLLELNVTNPTDPTGPELVDAIGRSLTAILGFRDYEGEPINLDARHFDVMVPMTMVSALRLGLVAPLCGGGYTVRIIPNPWLTWTDRIAVFRADGTAKPFIRQQEFISLAAVGAGSELEFNEEVHHYGVSTSRNGGYGLWEHACMTKLLPSP
jgi:phage major head subunit gpT-like protein